MSKSYKSIETSDCVNGALSAACDEIRSLTEEMSEWRDNMDGSGLENTEKFERVSECADALESADVDQIEEMPSECGDADDLDVTVILLQNKNKRRSNARWARLANAQSYLEVVVSALQDKVSDLQGDVDDLEEQISKLDEDEDSDEIEELEKKRDELEEQRSAVDEFVTEVESVVSELESVEFPGMFG